jgi:multiple sugar transport system ATP-binding protein
MAEISLEQVTKEHPGGVVAVEDLTLTIREGEILVLVGPSGSGKTTTLRLIAGLEAPTRGVIRIGGRDARGLPPQARDVALVFQRPAVHPHLSVRRNLAFPLQLRAGLFRQVARWFWPSPTEVERVQAVAHLLRLEGLLDRPAGQLSGGQQQRVALGRALVRQAGTLLLDEPLASLDAPLRLELRRELHLLHRRFPVTMVYVTHDALEAMSLGDRVVILRRGAVQQIGTPEAIRDRPASAFVAAFFGAAPTNFFDGCLVLEGGTLAFLTGERRFVLPAHLAPRWAHFAGSPLTLGLRAEDVEVLGPGGSAGEPGGLDLEADAVLVEPLGQGRLVTLAPLAGAVPDSANVFGCQPPGAVGRIEKGQRLKVRLHLGRAHLFDRATGLAVGSRGA